MALDHGEHVIEIMRHTGGELAHRIHLLRLAQLCFQVQSVSDVLDITMHDLADRDWVEGPRESTPKHLAFMAKHALSCVEAGSDYFIYPGRQNRTGSVLAG